MREQEHPELNYIRKLPKSIMKDIPLFLGITKAVLTKTPREFLKDAERISTIFEVPDILGRENIPQDQSPTIIACNHPETQDLVTSVIFLTKTFNRNVHWFMSKNIPQRGARGKIKNKLLLPAFDWIIPRFIETYGFIGVPTHQESSLRKRVEGIFIACKYLKEESDSRSVGIFPEGEMEFDGELGIFFNGVGKIAKLSGDKDLKIMPVAIYRDGNKKLVINIGKEIKLETLEDDHAITKSVRASIEKLLKAA